MPGGHAPFAAIAPDLTWHVAGLAKCIGAGLRAAYVVVPDTRSAWPFAAALRSAQTSCGYLRRSPKGEQNYPLELREKFNALAEQLCISGIALGELHYAAEKSARRAHNLTAIENFVARLDVLPFAEKAAAHYGQGRAELERAGTPSGPHDMQIGGHAKAVELVVVRIAEQVDAEPGAPECSLRNLRINLVRISRAPAGAAPIGESVDLEPGGLSITMPALRARGPTTWSRRRLAIELVPTLVL
ncbi:putative nucleic acid-binding protein [Bradyrhizobium sp. AZCC 2176]